MRVEKEYFQTCAVFLYGAGNLGKKLFHCFEENDIHVFGFIDRRSDSLKVKLGAVFSLDDTALNPYIADSVVVLSGLFGRAQERNIRNALGKRGFSHVCSLREIDWGSLDAEDFLRNIFIGDFNSFQLDKEETRQSISEVVNLFSTEAEREYIRCYIKAHQLRDYGLFPEPLELEHQYLADGLEEKIDLTVFVDCGAFDGDVLRRFLDDGQEVGTYIGFEPQMEFCRHISDTIASYRKVRQGIVFPCGVSDAWESIRFSSSSEGASAAKADAHGKEIIQCIPLDEALHGIRPTFLKMDIEGMEWKALHGASKTIREYHPQLAICVYHALSHIWEIPLYIKSLYGGYRFYIQNYQYMGLETVVYAFP